MIIEVSNMVKRYKEKLVLDHLDLEVNEGEIFGLLGPNGSGKTTLIKCLLGISDYEEGMVKLFDKRMHDKAYEIKRNIGVIMQEIGVYDEFTVYENIDYFCSLYIKDKAKRKEMVYEAMEMVQLVEYENMYPNKLSGGLIRRLNIACGIAHKPKLIIMDEPTIAVDVNLRNMIIEGIKKLNASGSTILYTSHYMEEVESLCSQIAILDHGKIVARGSKEALLSMIDIGESISVQVSSLEETVLKEIKALPHVERISLEAGLLEVKYKKGRNNLVKLLEVLTKAEVQVGDISNRAPNLNDVFMELTGKQL